MYNLDCTNNLEKKLNIPDFSSRYLSLISSNKKNIVIIKEKFDQSTFRYRGYNIIQTMRNNEKYNFFCFLVSELNKLYELVDNIDLVILQRSMWSFELESFINVLKKENIKLLFDIDDLIYNPKYVPQYLISINDTSEKRMNYYFYYSERLKMIASMCDGFIVTTKQLAKMVEKDFNKPVWIFHNYLNLEQEAVSKEIVDLKKKTYSDNKFVIGYFSGSKSHQRDLEVAESALIKLIEKYDKIYLKIVGYMEFSSHLKKLKDEDRVFISEYVSFEELQYGIGKVDLNIIPLQKHEFNACKSELKYFEASIVNTLTLATDNVVYKNIITDGVDGFLTDELSWFEKMEYIYLNYHKLNDVVDNARVKCLNEYGSKQQEKNLEKMYGEIFEYYNKGC